VTISEFRLEKSKSFTDKLARIYHAANVNNDSALARVLGIKAPSVFAARKRQQIPSGWVEQIAETCGVSSDWLFFGTGPIRSGEVRGDTPEPSPADMKGDMAELKARNAALTENNRLLEEALAAKTEALEAYKELLMVTRANLARCHEKKRSSIIGVPASAAPAPSISLTSEE
jgi:hypothetical protein